MGKNVRTQGRDAEGFVSHNDFSDGGEENNSLPAHSIFSPSELFSSQVVVGFGSEDCTSKILSSPCENKYYFAASVARPASFPISLQIVAQTNNVVR
jgi:hypothetical protein